MLKRFKAVSGLFGPVLCPLLGLSLFPVPFSFSPCPLFHPFLGFYGLFSAPWGASVCSVYAQGFKSILSFVLCAKFLAWVHVPIKGRGIWRLYAGFLLWPGHKKPTGDEPVGGLGVPSLPRLSELNQVCQVVDCPLRRRYLSLQKEKGVRPSPLSSVYRLGE